MLWLITDCETCGDVSQVYAAGLMNVSAPAHPSVWCIWHLCEIFVMSSHHPNSPAWRHVRVRWCQGKCITVSCHFPCRTIELTQRWRGSPVCTTCKCADSCRNYNIRTVIWHIWNCHTVLPAAQVEFTQFRRRWHLSPGLCSGIDGQV